jgi:hypothetical protein
LHSVKANNLVRRHAVAVFRQWWDSLHKADHGPVAVRIKLIVVSSFQICKLLE